MDERQRSAWMLVSLAVPVVQAASGISWPAVLAVGLACYICCEAVRQIQPGNQPKWRKALQSLWLILFLSRLLYWSSLCFPGKQGSILMPLVIVALAVWAACKGRTVAARSAMSLRYFLILLLGSVILAAVKETDISNLAPTWKMNSADLITVLLLPAVSGEGKKSTVNAVYITALLTSVISTGVVTARYASGMASPFYEMSRSLEFFGAAKRMESLVAAGFVMGYVCAAAYVMCTGLKSNESGDHTQMLACAAAAIGLNFVWRDTCGVITAMATLLCFIVVPMAECAAEKIKKKWG